MRRGAPAPSKRNVPIPAFEDARSLLLRNPIVRKPHDILRPNEQPQLETTGQENKAITPRGRKHSHPNIRVDNAKTKHTKHVEQRWPENASKPMERPPGRTPSRQRRQHNQRFRNQRRGGLSAVYSSQPAITATPAGTHETYTHTTKPKPLREHDAPARRR